MTKTQRVRSKRQVRALAVDFPGWGDPNYRDYFVDHLAGVEGEVVGTESHGSNPWTRYTVRWDDGTRSSGVDPATLEYPA
jgi:hypothetical protein